MQSRRSLAAVFACAACGGSSSSDAGFDVPLEQWTWVDVPGTACGNGTPTGIALNPTTRSRTLVIMFEGGGACWEPASCYGILVPVSASHLDGFGETTFASVRPQYFDNAWAFQRDVAASPFADASWAFVPYCTGDLHAGTQATVYEALGQQRTMHHVGAKNVDAVLARLARYAPSEVFAMGVSAGGYGVQLNWGRIASAFAPATTHVLADGAQLVPLLDGRWGTMVARWAPRFPEACADCPANLDRVAAHWRTGAPPGGGRHALLASLQDAVIALYFGYTSANTMRGASLAVGTAMTGTQAAFMIDNNSHTMLGAPMTQTSAGIMLRSWVGSWVTGDAMFITVGP